MNKFLRSKLFIMIAIFLLLFIFFSIQTGGIFLKQKNLMNILSAMSLSALLTEGVALLMISGKLDLSTGANGTLCGMFLAYSLRAGVPAVPAIILTLLLGAFVGLVNAAIVNTMNIAPFIATLATTSIITGFIYILADKKSIDVVHPFFRGFGKAMLFGIPVTALFAFVLMVIIGVVLHQTTFGRKIYLVGGNPNAAMLSGVNPKKMSYILFVICGIFSSLAGITFVSRMQTANIQGIASARFQGITAAVLGGISFGGGSGNMAGAFVGLLVLSTFNNGMTVSGIKPHWQNVASGLLLLFALTLDYFHTRQNSKAVA